MGVPLPTLFLAFGKLSLSEIEIFVPFWDSPAGLVLPGLNATSVGIKAKRQEATSALGRGRGAFLTAEKRSREAPWSVKKRECWN